MDFFALALVMSNTSETSALIRWARLALAGLAVGVNLMEAFDIGAVLSGLSRRLFYSKPLWMKAGRL